MGQHQVESDERWQTFDRVNLCVGGAGVLIASDRVCRDLATLLHQIMDAGGRLSSSLTVLKDNLDLAYAADPYSRAKVEMRRLNRRDAERK